MIQLRIVAPPHSCKHVMELLEATETAFNLVHLRDAARKPRGDLFMCDVASRDVSLLVADLRELDIDVEGSIAIDGIDAEIAGIAEHAHRRRRNDIGADPVVWENVTSRTSESVELSHSFLVFMTIAMLIAGVGIYLDQPILIVGAMVVGPDFGPIAGACVALVNRSAALAWRSLAALGVGFPLGIVATFLATAILRETGAIPETVNFQGHRAVSFIVDPDFFSVYVAFAAGIVGMLSLTTAKSSVLVGVLISVATIPSAANIGVAAAYGDWNATGDAAVQLGLNLVAIFVAGSITLLLQRRIYVKRRRRHLSEEYRREAGLPVGRSRRGKVEPDQEPEPS